MMARRCHMPCLRGTIGALSVLAIFGCAGNGAAPRVDGQPAVTNDPIALFAASSSPGAEGTVVLADTGQAVRVRLMRAYAAASGRECREVAVGPSQAVRLICNADGAWIPARPLLSGTPERS